VNDSDVYIAILHMTPFIGIGQLIGAREPISFVLRVQPAIGFTGSKTNTIVSGGESVPVSMFRLGNIFSSRVGTSYFHLILRPEACRDTVQRLLFDRHDEIESYTRVSTPSESISGRATGRKMMLLLPGDFAGFSRWL